MKTKKLFVLIFIFVSINNLCGQKTIHTLQDLEFKIEGDLKGAEVKASSEKLEKDLYILSLTFTSPDELSPGPVSLTFIQPGKDIQALFHPEMKSLKSWLIPWEHYKVTNKDYGYYSSAFRNAPLFALYSSGGMNRLTFACSEIVEPLVMGGFIHKIKPEFKCFIKLFTRPHKPFKNYTVDILIDRRDCPLTETMQHITNWWTDKHKIKPLSAPVPATVPYYSTWYTFGRTLMEPEVELQAKAAADMGCEAIILDDGWQLIKDTLGADYYGDWKAAENRFPDFQKHIEKTQSLGMKYLVWHALPLLGEQSDAYQKLKGKFLFYLDWARAYIPDPRFPEVRDYYVKTITENTKKYKPDGYKLDFFEQFWYENPGDFEHGNGRDFFSVEKAGLKMLDEIITALKEINPDILIEFRQQYTGPAMWPHGNMFRAGDCQYSAIDNRLSCMDIRLVNPDIIVHGDMLTWNKKETPEAAAKQILNVFFAVPQISVKLNEIGAEQAKMVKFLLAKWSEYKKTLVRGSITAKNPELHYPYIETRSDEQVAALFYADIIPEIDAKQIEKILIVNAKDSKNINFRLKNIKKTNAGYISYSCTGKKVESRKIKINNDIITVQIPVSGLAELTLK